MWFVDPDLLRRRKRLRGFADKAFRVDAVGGIEDGTPPLYGLGRQSVMNHRGREKAQAAMAVLVVIPGKELLGETSGILKGPKAIRETGPVLQSSEVALRIWVVIGDVRAAVGFGDTEICHEERDRFGGHGRTAVGMDR